MNEWENWLNNFYQQDVQKNGKSTFSYIPNAAWILNDLYWKLAEQYLRPLLSADDESEEHRIHPYKIISASEIAVMMTLPVEIAGTEEFQKTKNALLAWFIATQILEGWNKDNKDFPVTTSDIEKVAAYKEYVDSVNRYPESFAAEHIIWLTYLNS